MVNKQFERGKFSVENESTENRHRKKEIQKVSPATEKLVRQEQFYLGMTRQR